MADIFDIRTERERRAASPTSSYFVRVDQYADGIAGAVLDLGDDLGPDDLRTVANHLSTLSRWMRDQAEVIDGNEDEAMLAELRVFKSGRVWTFVSNECTTDEQVEWLSSRLDDAKKVVGP